MANESSGAQSPTELFLSAGKEIGEIPVIISYRIIELFSDGLYASPTKAIEELVSNSFDAGATNVHVILPPDLTAGDASIAIVDDGESMDESGLQKHWIIGFSEKQSRARLPNQRKQIGKFGIGKLATFVLAKKFTHICKRGSKYFAVTMDYNRIPQGKGGVEGEEVLLPLRRLTEEEAKLALPASFFGDSQGFKAIPLFGKNAPKSWTIAIMSSLKDLAREIQLGRLEWVLKTAMPIQSDFSLYLNGNWIRPTKFDQKPVKTWILGKDITPKSGDLQSLDITNSPDKAAPTQHRFGLSHPVIGRVTGFVEIYENTLTEHIYRSHGFFVYVHERLINPDDSHFGISANKLRHGTFSRFRMIVHIDSLDQELRSSRENVRDTQLKINAQSFLVEIFNIARNFLQNLAYWFSPNQTVVLAALCTFAESLNSKRKRMLLSLAISSAIVRKWPSTLSRAMDIDHSRPHRGSPIHKTIGQQFKLFKRIFTEIIESLIKVADTTGKWGESARIIQGDCVKVLAKLRPGMADLVLTSPPYVNAIDYPRAHKFSEWWLTPHSQLCKVENYIGLRRTKNADLFRLASKLAPEGMKITSWLRRKAPSKFQLVCKYVEDMSKVIRGCRRVLRKNGKIVFVLADNKISGRTIPVINIVKELLVTSNFKRVRSVRRKIKNHRRRYPFGFDGVMKSEAIIIASK